MKLLAIIICLFVSPQVFAQVENSAKVHLAELPEAIVCTSNARYDNARAVELTNLNTTSPRGTFNDDFQMASVENGKFTISFSDECESWFAVEMSLRELKKLKTGKKKQINAEVSYSELAELVPPYDDEGNENGLIEEKVAATCKLKQ